MDETPFCSVSHIIGFVSSIIFILSHYLFFFIIRCVMWYQSHICDAELEIVYSLCRVNSIKLIVEHSDDCLLLVLDQIVCQFTVKADIGMMNVFHPSAKETGFSMSHIAVCPNHDCVSDLPMSLSKR